MAETGQGIVGEPGEQPTYFWQAKTSNLLLPAVPEPGEQAPPAPASPVAGGQHRTFPFSLSIPETYIPSTNEKAHKGSLKHGVASMFKRGHVDATESPGPTDHTGGDGGAPGGPEERPLPRTYLLHDQDKPEMKDQPVIQYSVSVSLSFAGMLAPDVTYVSLIEHNYVLLTSFVFTKGARDYRYPTASRRSRRCTRRRQDYPDCWRWYARLRGQAQLFQT